MGEVEWKLRASQSDRSERCRPNASTRMVNHVALHTDQGNSDLNGFSVLPERFENSQSLHTDQGNSDLHAGRSVHRSHRSEVAIPPYRSGQFRLLLANGKGLMMVAESRNPSIPIRAIPTAAFLGSCSTTTYPPFRRYLLKSISSVPGFCPVWPLSSRWNCFFLLYFRSPPLPHCQNGILAVA